MAPIPIVVFALIVSLAAACVDFIRRRKKADRRLRVQKPAMVEPLDAKPAALGTTPVLQPKPFGWIPGNLQSASRIEARLPLAKSLPLAKPAPASPRQGFIRTSPSWW